MYARTMAELVASSASSPLVVCSGPHGARVRADASLSSAPAFEMPRGAVARVLARRGVYRDDGRKAERLLIDWRGRQGWASAPFFAAVDETVRRRASSEAKKTRRKRAPSRRTSRRCRRPARRTRGSC